MVCLAKYRYPKDPYDRIWNADRSFTPFHVTTGFKIHNSFNQSNVVEEPPAAVIQTGRVLARRNMLTYSLPFDVLGDYYIILYFAGILPVLPSFDVLINGDLVQSNYTIKSSEISALYVTLKGINSLNITLRSISFYPQINAFEVYNMVDIPPEVSSTTGASPACLRIHFIHISTHHNSCYLLIVCSICVPVSAMQVIQQSTGLDLGWQDDPCSPFPWDHIDCAGTLVTSLCVNSIYSFIFSIQWFFLSFKI